jgi:hypothetical protein
MNQGTQPELPTEVLDDVARVVRARADPVRR